MKSRKRMIGWIVLGGALSLFLPLLVIGCLYERQYGERNETPEYLMYDLSVFSNLERSPISFESNDGQLLAGYVYTSPENDNPLGTIIVSSGIEKGHNAYLPEINYMVNSGYRVFAYDGTGNDESEGESTGGYLQAAIDLDYAIRKVKEDKRYGDLPVMLYGHGSGGYAVVSVLNHHQDITAVVEQSGFYASTDAMPYHFQWLKPYIKLYEYLKYGNYAREDHLNVLMHTNSHVLLLHSEDDEVTSYEQSFFKYEPLLSAHDHLTFRRYQNRGHDVVLDQRLIKTLKLQVDADLAEEKMSPTLKRMYQRVFYDAKKNLDVAVMQQIIDFYNQWIYAEYE